MAPVHNWVGQGVNTVEQIDLELCTVTCPDPTVLPCQAPTKQTNKWADETNKSPRAAINPHVKRQQTPAGFGYGIALCNTCTATLAPTGRTVLLSPTKLLSTPTLLLYINSTWNMLIISSVPQHSRVNVSSEPPRKASSLHLLSYIFALLFFNIQLLSLPPRRAAPPRQNWETDCVCVPFLS